MNIINKLILSEDEVVNLFRIKLKNDEPFIFTYLNVHCYNIYNDSFDYKNVLTDDIIIYPDGVGIWLLLKKLGKNYLRFNATDLNHKLIQILIELKKSFLIIGGDYDEKIIKNDCHANGLNYAGYINGFLSDDTIISGVMNNNAEVIFIGIGVPRQEILAQKIRDLMPSKKIICVGNYFNFYFNFQKRAPLFLQYFGLEWLYRLLCEPKRLFYRYTLGNLKFIFRIIKQKNEK